MRRTYWGRAGECRRDALNGATFRCLADLQPSLRVDMAHVVVPILMDAGQPLSDLNARWWGGRATGEAFKTAFRLAQHSTWARVVEQRYSTHTASGEELRAQRVPDNYSCELRLRLSQRAHRRMWMRFLRLCSAIRRSLRGSSLCLSSLCLSSVSLSVLRRCNFPELGSSSPQF
jgi:hypothetical protein